MTPGYLVTMLVTAVACLSCSQAFAPVRHRHIYTSEELLGNRGGNSPARRKQQLVPRREGGLRTLRLHGPSDAKWCSSDDSSRGDYQGNYMDNDLFEIMTRLDFGVGLTATGVSMLFGAVPKQASADESTAVSETVRDPSPVVTEMASRSTEEPSLRDLGFEVSYTGKSLPLSKFLGSKATLVVNSKIDDPESLNQMPGITKLATEYGNQGLNVLLFPTDQGTFEADEDRVVRIKLYQFYGFGQYPRAVVFDKVDIVGSTIHPFYRYLCRALKNPNGIARITLNYEKFLLDKDGRVLRRYPRRLQASDFEQDVKAALAEQPLPAETRDYKLAWLKADQEASKSEYAFKLGLNYYNN